MPNRIVFILCRSIAALAIVVALLIGVPGLQSKTTAILMVHLVMATVFAMLGWLFWQIGGTLKSLDGSIPLGGDGPSRKNLDRLFRLLGYGGVATAAILFAILAMVAMRLAEGFSAFG